MSRFRVSVKTHKKRIEKVKEELQKRGLDALVLMNPTNIIYMSGYFPIATERPIQLIIPVEGDLSLLIPRLEDAEAEETLPWIKDKVAPYLDTPGVPNYLTQIAKAFKERGLDDKKLGTDGISVKYSGPIAEKFGKELPGAEFVYAGDIVLDMRMIKDEEELNLIRQSATWGHLAMSILHDSIEPGLNPTEVRVKSSLEATQMMLRALGPEYARSVPPTRWGPFLTSATLRVGPRWYHPHWMYLPPMPSRKFKVGDVIKFGGSCNFGGYSIEHDRMGFIGEPSDKHKKRFNINLKAKMAAFDAVKPGVKICEIDKACNKVFKDAGMDRWIKHHTGHGIGLDGHEAPWVDEGDETIIRTGMVFSIEQGLFLKEEDMMYHNHETVVVTEDGCEWLSRWGRDLESCIIKV